MPELNASIRDIPIPPRMARRPISEKGFPVPYFVTHKDEAGEWDFRQISGQTILTCFKRRLCWLCGEPLGQYLAFTIGPMCSINRVSSEPPAHRECAEYGVRACPFLSKPRMRRNREGLPDLAVNSPGIAVEHNPGATLIWVTKSYRPINDGRGGTLFEIGDPVATHWYAEGRKATRAEIEAAINKGLPILRHNAAKEGKEAMTELDRYIARAMPLLPAE